MSTSMIASYTFAGNQIIIYGGISVIVIGVLGSILNIIVFLSLRTFRQSSCAFYLTTMSIINIGQLLFGMLPRILAALYNTDGSETSLFYCKFRFYFSHVCSMTSITCYSLATIDQYCATCSYPRFQRWCNIKLARCVVLVFIVIWLLHAIPYAVFYNHVISSATGETTCIMTNDIYIQYRAYVIGLLYTGFSPISISVIFGSMAYYNVRQLAHYTVPLVRRELDKQLTVMVLLQVFVNFFCVLPFSIVNALQLNTTINSNPVFKAQLQFSSNLTIVLFYLFYANPFYIYICASERFRRQLIYVLFKIHWNRCRQRPRMVINQVVPKS